MRSHDDFINPKSLVEQINLANTVNGGVSATYLHISHNSERALIRMRMPGVSQDAYRLSVALDQLQIHTVLSTDENKTFGEQPTLTRSLPLPAIINVEGIEARFEDGMLLVMLPFKTPNDRLPREIQIGF
ncbi:MAG: Hsp20/alpha crystallin family protein [Bernardetiaceae bacterium]|nr:Hsp20/alpha crystallin family protein [Bernardetiaceae bacterium]